MDFESPENDDDDDFHIEKIQTKFIDNNCVNHQRYLIELT